MFQQSRGEYMNKEPMLFTVHLRFCFTVKWALISCLVAQHPASTFPARVLPNRCCCWIWGLRHIFLPCLFMGHITRWHLVATFPSWRVNPSVFPAVRWTIASKCGLPAENNSLWSCVWKAHILMGGQPIFWDCRGPCMSPWETRGCVSQTLWVCACVCVCVFVQACSFGQSCLTLCDPMDCNLSGSSVHGILQAGILEWVAVIFSRASSRPRDRTSISCVSCINSRILYHW